MESMWLTGPEWLKSYDENTQRVNGVKEEIPSKALEEAKAKDRADLTETSLLAAVSGRRSQVSAVIDCKRFSTLSKLLSVTAIVLHFIDKLKGIRKDSVQTKTLAHRIQQAEELWIIDIQGQLRSNPKFKDWEREFGMRNDEKGILRCGGRLHNADLTESQIHPVVLDSGHYVTSLFVKYSHERINHGGVKETLTELRSRFWIIRGRQYVRKEIYRCMLGADVKKESLPRFHLHFQSLELQRTTHLPIRALTLRDHFTLSRHKTRRRHT